MRRDEANDKEERRGFRPIDKMKRKQDGNCKKTGWRRYLVYLS
jgi:hypothetical protein